MSTIQLDDALVELLRTEPQSVENTARELIVLGLYARGMISRGKGAELLSLRLADFLQLAARHGIAYFQLTEEELQQELAASRAL